jgi:hypothetical protein
MRPPRSSRLSGVDILLIGSSDALAPRWPQSAPSPVDAAMTIS